MAPQHNGKLVNSVVVAAVTGTWRFSHKCGIRTTMAYLVRITEWKTGGREFLISYDELPPVLAESISQAESTPRTVALPGSPEILREIHQTEQDELVILRALGRCPPLFLPPFPDKPLSVRELRRRWKRHLASKQTQKPPGRR